MRLAVVLLALVSLSSKADMLGIYGGVGYWNGSFGGDVISDQSVDDELNVDADDGLHVYVGFEHPIPLIPNIKVSRTGIKDSGTGNASSDFSFAGNSFTLSQTIATTVDLTHTDVTLYYELIDIGFDLDLGITGRWLDGEVQIDSFREDVSVLIPLVYASARVGLPFSGLYVGADVNGIGLGSSSVSDYAVKLGWQKENFILPEFGIEVGYRRFGIDGDANDIDVDMDIHIDGVFVNLVGHF
jgi:outer membrane protein|tara:strand:- start:755 stop:1480 length:726 start_codon:yes stop_codon:yes gene_type:complete